MKVENLTRQPLVINLGMDAQGKPKDIHLKALGLAGASSRELTPEEVGATEVQRHLRAKRLRLV